MRNDVQKLYCSTRRSQFVAMKDLKNVGWLRIVDNVEQANDDGQLNILAVSFEIMEVPNSVHRLEEEGV